jgi:hypothetical protein
MPDHLPLSHISFLLLLNPSIWNTKLITHTNETTYNPDHFVHLRFGTNRLNPAYLARKLVVQPTSCKFTLPPFPIRLSLLMVQQRLCIVALPSYTTLLSLSQYFLYSPSSSFLQFQLVYCSYVSDSWSGHPVCSTGRCTQPFLTLLPTYMKYIK